MTNYICKTGFTNSSWLSRQLRSSTCALNNVLTPLTTRWYLVVYAVTIHTHTHIDAQMHTHTNTHTVI